MNEESDWDSHSAAVQENQLAAYDQMRHRCPVAYDHYLGYSVFRHGDVMALLAQPEVYSSRVSARHLAIPSGLDGEEHRAFRAINDKYYTPERLATFAPRFRAIIRELVRGLPVNGPVEIMEAFAKPYAMRLNNAFMGWHERFEAPLSQWIEKNRRATLEQDRAKIAAIALEFDQYIHEILEERRQRPHNDITAELMDDLVPLNPPRKMSEEELVSLIRNWTVGELSTVAASAAIVLKFLAANPAEQGRLRADFSAIPAALEEMLRLEDPLVSNRRKTSCPAQLGGRALPAGAPITINWVSANRDEAAFPDALSYKPERDQSKNLVYGWGPHRCPGAPLARLELRLLLEEMLSYWAEIAPAEANYFDRAIYPIAGYRRLNLRLSR